MISTRSKSWAGVLVVAMAIIPYGSALGALPTMDSVDFAWKYEMDALPSTLDLDGNGSLDFFRSSSSITTDGNFVTLPANQYFESLGSGIWQNNFDYAAGYTIEARVKVLSQTSGNGAFALYSCAGNTGLGAVLKVGATDQGWGRTASDLGTNSNTDDFHVFRVVQIPGADSFAVWRDDVLVGGGLAHVSTSPNSFWFGDGLGAWEGSSRVDHVRITPGAYAPPGCIYEPPPPPPPPFTASIVKVEKDLYRPAPASGVCQWCWSSYVGPAGQLVENYAQESAATGDDVHVNKQRRFSNDNGQTWSALESMPDNITYYNVSQPHSESLRVQDVRGEQPFYDPVAGVVLRFYQQWAYYSDNSSYSHTFYDISNDNGHTYGTWNSQTQSYSDSAKLVTYESGGAYTGNPADWNYVQRNACYPGVNTARLSNGTIVTALTESFVTVDGSRQQYGSRCLIGTWDAPAHDYDWTVGAPTWIPSGAGFHGLYESQVAELDDGRLLLTYRTDSGHRYYGLSTDGGLTISTPTELLYDDGTEFYSPSSISKMIRSSDTGKLYFIGNITPDIPSGNSPRYPLVIAEIDETGVPAIVKDTVTVIDTLQPDEAASLQLSNFSLLENKATHELELLVSPLGYIGGYEAPVRKYTLTFLLPGDLNEDGYVGAADLDIVRAHWGQHVTAGSRLQGDPSRDGYVGAADLDVVRAHWGEGTPPSPGGVPEPSVPTALAGAALMGVLGAARRHRTPRSNLPQLDIPPMPGA